LPFADGSVRGLFAEHFFEHVDYTEEVPSLLSECHRVLQPGGRMRIIVPDAEQYMRAYLSEGWEALAALRPLHEGRVDHYFRCRYNTKMELINVVFRQGGQHKFAYDFETMKFVLEQFGFVDVRREQFGHSQMPELCIDSPRRATESLYVEAINGDHRSL
jgi:predicted SAM-dependent methyltransferase